MPEISLADLLAWEPRLRYAAVGAPGADAALDQEVTWAVTLRATPPLLPQLRGGEIVLLPPRLLAEAAAESDVTLPGLLRVLVGHRITAVVLEAMPPAAPLPILTMTPVTPELESELNRLLTQRRGELYRVGTELGRILANLTASQATLEQIAAAASDVAGYPLTVADDRGQLIAAAAPAGRPREARSGVRLSRRLASGATLRLDGVPPARQALARLLADRIATAIETALARSARERPRGAAREAALRRLLTGQAATPDPPPAALGLASGIPLRVGLAGPGLSDEQLHRSLAALGTAHAAGRIDHLRAALIEDRGTPTARGWPGRPSPRVTGPVRPAVPAEHRATGAGWLALSAPVALPGELPRATRQARYVAALLETGAVPGPIVRFDAIAELGVFGLLYPLWGSPDLASFVVAALGELPAHDRRGLLRQTWLAYLEAGGSHVEAAAALGVHRNTLTYRLKQIAALTGHDPDDPATHLVAHLALLAAKMPPPPGSPGSSDPTA